MSRRKRNPSSKMNRIANAILGLIDQVGDEGMEFEIAVHEGEADQRDKELYKSFCALDSALDTAQLIALRLSKKM